MTDEKVSGKNELKKLLVCYDSDASRLAGSVKSVVFPESKDEVCEIVKNASADIVARGSGTNLVGGCVPQDSIVIDLGRLNKVSKFDKEKRSVYVEAGVSVKELNEKLKQVGYEFPVFLIGREFSTIGGLIALNILGDRNYGEVKDWIEEIEFVNGRGELMKAGKADLMDVCGMEGITGIIVRARLKVQKLVDRSASIFQSDDLDEVLSISRRLKLENEVIMLKFFSKEVSKMLGFPEKYHIIIEFDSERGKIKREEYKKIMKVIKKSYYALYSKGYYYSEDPRFFFDKIKEFILLLEEKSVPYFGDLIEGIIHPFFKDDENDKREEVLDFIKKTKTHISRYGIGLKRKEILEDSEKKLIQRVKLRHDPFAKLNKGKVIDIDFAVIESKIEKKEGVVHPPFRIFKEEKVELIEEHNKKIPEKIVIKKTPEQKMREFVERVKKESEFEKKEKEQEEIQERLKDYEQTFKSELDDERKERVEKFAKEIAGEIVKKDEKDKIRDVTILDELDKKGYEKRRGYRTKEEKDFINKIMTNQPSDKPSDKNRKEEK